MKQDIVNSTMIGASVGFGAAILILIVAYLTNWTETPAGWIPFIFLTIILLGFFAWEGGLRGAESPNAHFRRFETALENGKHVFFVDLTEEQGDLLHGIVVRHPSIEAAGTARGSPHWIVFWQHRLKRFFTETFP